MNNELCESLPDDVRGLADACAAAAVNYGSKMADKSISEYKQQCIDAGCRPGREAIGRDAQGGTARQRDAPTIYRKRQIALLIWQLL